MKVRRVIWHFHSNWKKNNSNEKKIRSVSPCAIFDFSCKWCWLGMQKSNAFVFKYNEEKETKRIISRETHLTLSNRMCGFLTKRYKYIIIIVKWEKQKENFHCKFCFFNLFFFSFWFRCTVLLFIYFIFTILYVHLWVNRTDKCYKQWS